MAMFEPGQSGNPDGHPGEAAHLSQLVTNYTKALEIVDLEERVSRLEDARASR